jgi:predicted flavoprotein YhiN
MTDATNFIDWEELQGKEARGVNKNVDLGEVQQIGRNYVVTKKGITGKEIFYIPKYLAERYDGHTLWFNVTEGQKTEFSRQAPPTYDEYVRYRTATVPTDIESRIRIAEA